MKAPRCVPLGAPMQLGLKLPHLLFGRSHLVLRHTITSLATYNHLLSACRQAGAFPSFPTRNNQGPFAPRTGRPARGRQRSPRLIATMDPSDSCRGPRTFSACGRRTLPSPHAPRLRVRTSRTPAGLPSCAPLLSRRAAPTTPPQPPERPCLLLGPRVAVFAPYTKARPAD